MSHIAMWMELVCSARMDVYKIFMMGYGNCTFQFICVGELTAKVETCTREFCMLVYLLLKSSSTPLSIPFIPYAFSNTGTFVTLKLGGLWIVKRL